MLNGLKVCLIMLLKIYKYIYFNHKFYRFEETSQKAGNRNRLNAVVVK